MSNYQSVKNGEAGFVELKRGLIEVSGSEAIQFLNGLITNDVEKLEDGAVMDAAFPNVKGRMIALVRVMRRGDAFFFETEEATYEAILQNLERFTLAGDFKVNDFTADCRFFRTFNFDGFDELDGDIRFGDDFFLPANSSEEFTDMGVPELSLEEYEYLRVEHRIPVYGKDMDDSTVVPEVNIEGLISYEKGCYIGQEVIARIHFLGKPAKLLVGLEFDAEPSGTDLETADGKNAGRVTSTVQLPDSENWIGMGFVRNAFAEKGTELLVGRVDCKVQ